MTKRTSQKSSQNLIPKAVREFIASLEKIYTRKTHLTASWPAEKSALVDILPKIIEDISFNYQIRKPIAVGGGGIVATCLDKNLKVQRILKISRPSPGKEQHLAKILLAETRTLLRLNHQNLMRVYAQGAAPKGDQTIPYYIMDYIDGVLDADEYMLQRAVNAESVFGIFMGALQAIEYLHAQNTIHLDLKPANLLVTPTGVPVVSDLGFAKELKLQDGYTVFGGTEGYMHPDARSFIVSVISDPNRASGTVPREELKREWDLYSLGKTFLELLKLLDGKSPPILSGYQRRYLRLLSCRLLDGQNGDDELAVGLSRAAFQEIKYTRVQDARIDLEKLVGSFNLEARLPELNAQVPDTIQVAAFTPTPFTGRVKAMLRHPLLGRLGHVTQLGYLNLVYPTATHSRLEHSFGTFSVLCRYIVALYDDALNPLFKQLMTEVDLRAALVAGLLHDLGQYPLAHDVEEADPFMVSHEEIGRLLLDSEQSQFKELIESEWAVPLSRVIEILEADPSQMQGDLKSRILHSLIDGPIDADKIDYLLRDSARLGLTYGSVIDLDRLLRCLTIAFRSEGDTTHAALGIHEKGKVTAEAVAFARYAMFGQVYWHHAYRAFKIMLHRIIWEALEIADKESGGVSKLRASFRQYVVPDLERDSAQGLLFPADAGLQVPEGETAVVNSADRAVVRWFADRGGADGAALYRMISHRTLFKRLLVVSPTRQVDKAFWDRLSDFSSSSRRSWQKKLAFQTAFQQEIARVVEAKAMAKVSSIMVTPDQRNRFLAATQTGCVLLVDIPPDSRHASPLEFLIEEDRRKYKVDEIRTGNLETSIVWRELQKNFRTSVGKMRVFCHPEQVDFLGSFLQRSEIENALGAALRVADAK